MGLAKVPPPLLPPTPRCALYHEPPGFLPFHSPSMSLPRDCALTAGSALETRGREPPSHHPCKCHLCHTPPMPRQPHEPDQESTGSAQWQCQCSLHFLCKLLSWDTEGVWSGPPGGEPFGTGRALWQPMVFSPHLSLGSEPARHSSKVSSELGEELR